MPVQAPQWSEFLSCPICFNVFDAASHRPISLGCGHTVCKVCLSKLSAKKCPFDQSIISRDINELPVNFALLQLVGVAIPESQDLSSITEALKENREFYNSCSRCIEELARYLKPVDIDGASGGGWSGQLTRPMQRKLVTLVNCQLLEDEGRARGARAARSLGERTVTELILLHQNPQQLSANLWAAVRARGCQFLGPAMQEEVLKLILLSLEDGSALSRKVLVLFVVQRLENQYPQASKTAIGHVVQLLYRASCFKVTKRDEESSLMQLKEEFCTYEALRREHDSQIVQIATEAGLRISPEQWSSLLYGDTAHKSHMQSIIDKLQTPQSFSQSISELTIALQRTGDPTGLSSMHPAMELLASVDPNPDSGTPSWQQLESILRAVGEIVEGLLNYLRHRGDKGRIEPDPASNPKFKTSLCRDMAQTGTCPRGQACTFAHSQEELEMYRYKSRRYARPWLNHRSGSQEQKSKASSSLTVEERETLAAVSRTTQSKLSNTQTTKMYYEPRVSSAEGHQLPYISVPVAKPSALPPRLMGGGGYKESSIYMHQALHDMEQMSPSPLPCTRPSPEQCLRKTCGDDHQHSRVMQPHLHAPPESLSQVNMMSVDLAYHRQGASSYHSLENAGVYPHLLDKNTLCPQSHLYELQIRRQQLLAQLSQGVRSTSYAGYHQVASAADMSHQLPVEQPWNRHVAEAGVGSLMTPMVNMSLGHSAAAAANLPQEHMLQTTSCSLYSWSSPTVTAVSWCAPTVTAVWSSGDNQPDSFSINDDAQSVNLAAEDAANYNPWTSGPWYTFGTSESGKDSEHSFQGTQEAPKVDCEGGGGQPYMTAANTAEESWSHSELNRNDDDFLPFSDEDQFISKFGPISRMVRSTYKDTKPRQVTAAGQTLTTPVMVPSWQGNPTPQPSMRMPIQQPTAARMVMPDAFLRPMMPVQSHEGPGIQVASSLPTALLQPNASKPSIDLPEKVFYNMHLQGGEVNERKLLDELAVLNKQIVRLKHSEEHRLQKELEVVEQDIHLAQERLSQTPGSSMPSGVPSQEMSRLAAASQRSEEAWQQLQQRLIARDQQVAEQLAVQQLQQQ